MSFFAIASAIASSLLPETLGKTLPSSSAEVLRVSATRSRRSNSEDRQPLLMDTWLYFITISVFKIFDDFVYIDEKQIIFIVYPKQQKIYYSGVRITQQANFA